MSQIMLKSTAYGLDPATPRRGLTMLWPGPPDHHNAGIWGLLSNGVNKSVTLHKDSGGRVVYSLVRAVACTLCGRHEEVGKRKVCLACGESLPSA